MNSAVYWDKDGNPLVAVVSFEPDVISGDELDTELATHVIKALAKYGLEVDNSSEDNFKLVEDDD